MLICSTTTVSKRSCNQPFFRFLFDQKHEQKHENGKQTDGRTTDKQANRKTDQQTNRQTDKKTNTQTDKHTHTHKHTNTQTHKHTSRQTHVFVFLRTCHTYGTLQNFHAICCLTSTFPMNIISQRPNDAATLYFDVGAKRHLRNRWQHSVPFSLDHRASRIWS